MAHKWPLAGRVRALARRVIRPQGQYHLAQGNPLGIGTTIKTAPCKGSIINHQRIMILPLQGAALMGSRHPFYLTTYFFPLWM